MNELNGMSLEAQRKIVDAGLTLGKIDSHAHYYISRKKGLFFCAFFKPMKDHNVAKKYVADVIAHSWLLEIDEVTMSNEAVDPADGRYIVWKIDDYVNALLNTSETEVE
jgi:hypothetical protein